MLNHNDGGLSVLGQEVSSYRYSACAGVITDEPRVSKVCVCGRNAECENWESCCFVQEVIFSIFCHHAFASLLLQNTRAPCFYVCVVLVEPDVGKAYGCIKRKKHRVYELGTLLF